MGGFRGNSGGEDKDVSGAEAVTFGGSTYGGRKAKNVNKNIAKTNQKNRDNRKNVLQKIFENTLIGKTAKAISDTEFVKDANYNRRLKFAEDQGVDTSKLSREFILSKGFKI